MKSNGVAYIGPTHPIPHVTFDEKKIAGSYLGGLLKFKTKVIWLNAVHVFAVHAGAAIGFVLAIRLLLKFQFLTVLYACFLGALGALGGSVVAHRYYSHRSFKAKFPLQLFFLFLYTLTGEFSLFHWVLRHKTHHKYSDTDADPHNASRGFWFSHIGWLMLEVHPAVKQGTKTIDMSEYAKDPIIRFEKKFNLPLHFLVSISCALVPVYLWDESVINAIFICYIARWIVTVNSTFMINSFAHIFGTKPYDKNIHPTEHIATTVMTLGEGWHNYHHAFPIDYKNAEFVWGLNFSATFIEWCAWLGLAYDLKQATPEVVSKTIKAKGDGSHSLSKNASKAD